MADSTATMLRIVFPESVARSGFGLRPLGAERGSVFLGTMNASHPGGMLPLTDEAATSFHDERLPDNVYGADSTLFPRSLGNPPILTIVGRRARSCA